MLDAESIKTAIETDYPEFDISTLDSVLWVKLQVSDILGGESGHNSQIGLTYGETLTLGESPVDDFFPSLQLPKSFSSRKNRLRLSCSYLEKNIESLGGDISKLSDEFVVTRMVRNPEKRPNPSLQVYELTGIRRLLIADDILVFLHLKNSPSFFAIGIKKDSDELSATSELLELEVPGGRSKKLYVFADESSRIDFDYSKISRNSTYDISNCLTSLHSKPFLIFTGLSGSGKTRLAQKIAAFYIPKVAEEDSNPQSLLIAVGPDWNSRDSLLGYPDGLHSERYLTTPTLDLIRRANRHPEKPYFLILDEMNLSQVERYFADFLSAMESENRELHLYEGPDRFTELPSDECNKIPRIVQLPQNLFIIGTVNVDETTYQFSPKVLDRANVIDFKMEKGAIDTFFSPEKDDSIDAITGSLESEASAFVAMAMTSSEDTTEWASRQKFSLGENEITFPKEMKTIFNLLKEFDAEFGYRTLKEASRYLYFSEGGSGEDISPEDYQKAMDEIILQKILPKLHGSRGKLEGLLRALTYYCRTTEREGILKQALEQSAATSPSLDQMAAELGGETAHYEGSHTKLCKMCRKLAQNSFVSFAEA